jgi:hypothetical protein
MFYRLKRFAPSHRLMRVDCYGQSRVGGMMGFRRRGLMWRRSGAWKSKTGCGLHAMKRLVSAMARPVN